MRLFFLATIFCISTSCAKKDNPLDKVSAYFEVKATILESQLLEFEEMIRGNKRSAALQDQFKKARSTYKEIESLTEFYFPGLSESINGAAINKTDEYDDKIIEATGFQVVEEMIFPEANPEAYQKLLKEVKILSASVGRLKQLIAVNELTDANIFEAQRLEVLRIMSLGLSGFDSPISLQSITEAKNAFAGIHNIMLFYEDRISDKQTLYTLEQSFEDVFTYLDANNDFNDFNRAEFFKRYVNRLSSAIYTYQQELNIPNNPWLSAIDLDKPTFFEKGIFQANYFAPTHNRDLNTQVVELGKFLFFDPILSGNNQRSCASCHKPANAFSDSKRKSVAFNLEGEVPRNAPSLINSVFQKSQFWDQRVQFTEDQIMAVVNNAAEMHGHLKSAALKLQGSTMYRNLFAQAFKSDRPISDSDIQTALAAYVRSLYSLNSTFDKYLRDDEAVLTESEVRGFNLFMGKGKCGTCHFFPLFNGTVPPAYNETESEILGVPGKPDTLNVTIDSDRGKYHVYGRALHQYAFKTPSIRNSSLTAPYMHNGVYTTLDEVLDFYNRGGGAGIGIDISNQTLPPDRLNLSNQEKMDIIEFIRALTDTTGLTAVPVTLPKFDDALLNARKIGGTY